MSQLIYQFCKRGKENGKKVALLLMSHGDFATELMRSLEFVIGKQDNYETLGVHLNDQIDDLQNQMYAKIDSLDLEKGLVVFTDIVGGTPMNLAGHLLGRENILVCSGMNLPMLLECSFNRDKTVEELEGLIKAAYQSGMVMRTGIELKEEDEDDLLL